MNVKVKFMDSSERNRFISNQYRNSKKRINDFDDTFYKAFMDNFINTEIDKVFNDLPKEECKPMSNENENVKTEELEDTNSIISAELTETGINVFYHNKGEKQWLASFDYDGIGNAININCINPNKNETNFKGTLLMDDKAKKIYNYQKKLQDLKKKKRELNETLGTLDDEIIDVMNSINKLVSD